MTIYIHIRHGTTRGRFSVHVISIYTLGVLCTHGTRGNSEHVYLYRRRSRRERVRETESMQKTTFLIGLSHHAHFYTAFGNDTTHERLFIRRVSENKKKSYGFLSIKRVHNTHNTTNAYGSQQTRAGLSRAILPIGLPSRSILFPLTLPRLDRHLSRTADMHSCKKSLPPSRKSDTLSASTYT
jgi:hypothetical protein